MTVTEVPVSHPSRAARSRLRLLAVAVVVVGAGCGSSDSSATDTTRSTVSTVSTAPAVGSTGSSTTNVATPGRVISLVISGGRVEGGASRHDVQLGDEVTFRVISDIDEELHVHGYDRKLELTAGTSAEVTFMADIPGVFEVELEHSGLKVAELKVA